MYELTGPGRAAARPLIETLPSSIYAISVVEGRAPGRVFVDDVKGPGAALVWEATGNVYIASELTAKGLPAADTVRGIQDLLVSEFIPNAIRSRARSMCWVAYAPQSWGTALPSMLKDLPPMADKRLCYRAQGPDEAAIEHLSGLAGAPDGYEVHKADRELMESGLANVDDVRREAELMWGTVDRFLKEGFGYCVTSKEAVTAWSLSECPSVNRTSVGVETVKAYRREGHATVAAANTLLRCRRERLVADWDLWMGNEPSLKLAERLGLARVAEYPVRFFYFNKVDNMLVNGNVALKRGSYQGAAEWFDRAFEEAEFEESVRGSWLFADSSKRAWWSTRAADAYEEAGMPGMAKEMRERASREESSAG